MKRDHRRVRGSARHFSATLLGVATLLGAQAAGAATNLYVSPTGLGAKDCLSAATACTLATVQARVRAQNTNMSGDIIVNLAGGTYALTSTFQLTPLDSGSNNYSVIYQGPTNALNPAVFTGGVQLGNWTMHNVFKNIWKTTVSTGVDFRQFYVNGVAAVRARHPNLSNVESGEGYLKAVSTVTNNTLNFVTRAGDLPTFKNTSGVEVVWMHHWKSLRARLAGINGTSLSFKSPENTLPVYTQLQQDNAPYYVENDYNLMDTPGEWFLDTSVSPRVLYYIPRSGEVSSSSQFTVPQLETLVSIAGTASASVHHVQLKNLSFTYSNWNAPSTMGYGVYQGATFTQGNGGAPVPAAVTVKNADNIALENNFFRFTGAHGLLLSEKVSNYRVVHNEFSDVGAGGVYDIGASTNGTIFGNLVERFGRAYADGVGIMALAPKNLAVNYNEIRFGGYSGVSLGWHWDNGDFGLDNNQVVGNHIHHVMQVLDDGAGIYTLGRMMDSVIQLNYVHDVNITPMFGGYSTVGIYLDQGATGRDVSGNVVGNAYQSFKVNDMNHDTDKNKFTLNYYDNVDFGVATSGTSVVSGNVYVVKGTAWPSDAQPIINAAGIR